jgi:acyl-CoA reductase-like NAD-dependent aldehyde dehydrogenase
MTVQYRGEVVAALDAIKAIRSPTPSEVLAIMKTLYDHINMQADTTAEATMWENNTLEALARAADTIEFPETDDRRERLKKAEGPDYASKNLWR